MNPVRYDGGAVEVLNTKGVSSLRAAGKGRKPVVDIDVDRLHTISKEDHAAVPMYMYHECARSLRTQASTILGRIAVLEASTKQSSGHAVKISELRGVHDRLTASAADAKRLAYARRSRAHDWVARTIPKDRRPHVHVALTAIGFTINILWLSYLCKVATEHHQEKKRQAQQQ